MFAVFDFILIHTSTPQVFLCCSLLFFIFAGPDLIVIQPKLCDHICLTFTSFTLQCTFSAPALFVNWNLPGLPLVDLSTLNGHTVNDADLANGNITVVIDARMKYHSYACSVVYRGGILQVSDTIQGEGTSLV